MKIRDKPVTSRGYDNLVIRFVNNAVQHVKSLECDGKTPLFHDLSTMIDPTFDAQYSNRVC